MSLSGSNRYEAVSTLEKSERERFFDDHIDSLIAKKKENYWKLLDECKEITLDSTFKVSTNIWHERLLFVQVKVRHSSISLSTSTFQDIRKLIRDDPRYSKYSSSERKCEKQFNEYMRERVSRAKADFRQLLMETKKITDKSLSLVRDKDSGHMAEIEELLSKDRRYIDMGEGLADARVDILMSYMEELERRGPPPPPTASEPGRRPGVPLKI